MAVRTDARIGALAGAGEVLVGRTVRDLSADDPHLRKPWSTNTSRACPKRSIYRVNTPTNGLTS
jgi:hypothetical protein